MHDAPSRSLARRYNDYPTLKSHYPDAEEEIDARLPTTFGAPLETSIFFDSDHAHDRKTRRSITGMIAFVGRTPVHWTSRRQGAIASSTYTAEFMAGRTAAEEAVALRYTLRALGIPIEQPTNLNGDNLGMLQSIQLPDAQMKKKHIAISFHLVRESVAAGIVKPIKIHSKWNFADIFTKQIPSTAYLGHIRDLTTSGGITPPVQCGPAPP